jgi:hypothetical protein
MPAFEHPSIPLLSFKAEPRLLRLAAFYPAWLPMYLVYVDDR